MSRCVISVRVALPALAGIWGEYVKEVARCRHYCSAVPDDASARADEPNGSDDEADTAPQPVLKQRGKYWWVRWVILVVVVIVLTVEIGFVSDQLAAAWHSAKRANLWWVLASAVAAMASMHSFAQIQRTLLRSAGVKVQQWRSEAAFYAGNALSTTLPGGPLISATFIYRQQRLWGAAPVVASWQLVMSGVLQVVGLAVLGLGGAFLLGAKTQPFSLVFSLGGLLAILVLAQAVASRPEMLDGIGVRILRWFNDFRGKPATLGVARWREILKQLEAVHLTRRELSEAFGWSLFNWVADVACLAFAAYAVGSKPSLVGVMVAYAAARAAGSAVPLMPGGLLVVEAFLVPGLASSGMPLPDAISAMLIYRLVSWIFISAIGWVIFFFLFRGESQIDPDATSNGNGNGNGSHPETEEHGQTGQA
jgi:uncharacterized membrane protein YbhN (UPF0104 family)